MTILPHTKKEKELLHQVLLHGYHCCFADFCPKTPLKHHTSHYSQRVVYSVLLNQKRAAILRILNE